jgi:hypothetical protein
MDDFCYYKLIALGLYLFRCNDMALTSPANESCNGKTEKSSRKRIITFTWKNWT